MTSRLSASRAPARPARAGTAAAASMARIPMARPSGSRLRHALAWGFLALAASGCATTSPAARQALQTVRDQYMAGDYGAVIRTVATSETLAAAPDDTRVEALKLQAYSYCLTRYTRLCEDGFLRILRIEPSFRLPANESGHPMWGPVFEHARQAARSGSA
ncbi:Type VI secretion protein [Bordetella bronchialis]